MALPLWFVKIPVKPASSQSRFTMVDGMLHPSTCLENWGGGGGGGGVVGALHWSSIEWARTWNWGHVLRKEVHHIAGSRLRYCMCCNPPW